MKKSTIFIAIVFFLAPFIFCSYLKKDLGKLDLQDQDYAVLASDIQDYKSLEPEKPLVLYFGATWCNPCKLMKQVLKKEKVKKELERLLLIMYDVDKDKVPTKKYKVKVIPTIVFIKEGKEIQRTTGLISEDKLLEILKKL